MAETRPLKLPATFTHFDIYHIPLFSCKPVLMGRLNAPKSGLSNGRLRFMYENLAKIVIYLFNYLKFSRVVANTKLLVIDGSLQCDFFGFTFAASGQLLLNNKKAMV